MILQYGIRRLFRTMSPKLFALVGISLIGIIVLHQLSYVEDLAFASPLSESINLTKACPLSEPDHAHDTRTRIASGIPKLVHQIWKTADIHTYSTETSHESWKTSFEALNYTIKLWAEDDIVRLIKAKYSWLLPMYEGYSYNIQRADLARLVVVHAEGGIYADLDVYPMTVERIDCVRQLGLQAIFAPTAGNLGVSNHFFMAERGSSFLQWALEEAKRRSGSTSRRILLPYLRVFWSTGPMMVTFAFLEYICMFSPADHYLSVLEERYGKSVIQHKAGRSWHGLDGYLLNWFADNFSMQTLWLSILLFVVIAGLMCVMVRCSQRNRSPAMRSSFRI